MLQARRKMHELLFINRKRTLADAEVALAIMPMLRQEK
jgi:hypothetical protein